MESGAPEALLGCIWVVSVRISAVLAISCKKNTRHVRWTLDRKADTVSICISNSGGEWGGVLLGHLGSPGASQWCLLLLLLLYLLNLRDGRVLWMDLGAPDSLLGFNCIVFVCISAVLAISCKKNTRNVRWTLDRKAKTASICISNSGGEWGGVLLGHLASPGASQWCLLLLLLLLLYLLNLRDGRVLWMDLGAPDSLLGFNCVVFVCISAVLAISCKKNTRNVRWILDRKTKTARIYISNSGGEWV